LVNSKLLSAASAIIKVEDPRVDEEREIELGVGVKLASPH